MANERRIVAAVSLVLFATIAQGAEVVKTNVDGNGFVADFYFTADSTNKPGILFLGGSEGGRPRTPFADLTRDLYQEIPVGGLSVLHKFYQEELAKKALVEQATIKVEQIHGPMLLASGHDDPICPTEQMGDAICSRLQEKGFIYPCQHLKYPNAGHTLSETLVMGGTVEGNKETRADLTKRIMAFLEAFNSK